MTAAPDIRALSLQEVETLVDWAAGEGWNPGLADADIFHATDPGGFLGAFVDGEMAAGIAAVAYGADFGFIGLYICRPDMRGKGFGKAAWNAGMARLGNRTIGLDGVPAQQDNYRRMGFADAYRTVRYSGHPSAATIAPGGRIAAETDFAAIAELDRRHFPAERSAFLRRWVEAPRCAIVVGNGAGIAGYGVLRGCLEGFKIGPLFACDDGVAGSILGSLASQADGEIHIDVPASQTEFGAMLTAAGFSSGFETTRMYRGPAPSNRTAGVFGITTLELG